MNGAEAVAALLLGRVHGLVGVFKQRVGIDAIIGIQGDADAR